MLKHLAAAFATLLAATAAPAAARVESFTPQKEAKDVRQVVVRFSEPMVAFGDARADAPFDVDCAAPGRGRWSDARVWLYDFEHDLPAGLTCTFKLKPGLTSLAGNALEARAFRFDTGGPAVRASFPHEGWERIDEAQIFLLGLDAPADATSVREHAHCAVQGIGERIAVELIEGDERKRVIEAALPHAYRLFQVIRKRGDAAVLGIRDRTFDGVPIVALKCARPLPPGVPVSIVWDAGIRTASGVATRKPQTLPFRVRPQFTARQTCTRVNPRAGCAPVLPMALEFSAPVPAALAARVEVVTADGRTIRPLPDKSGAPTVEAVQFPGPFPERSEVQIRLPRGLVDDAGRTLANASQFPLNVRIDEAPPLLKFPSRFGILEAHAEPALPVSVRNVEPALEGTQLTVDPAPSPGSGRALRVDTADDAELARWLRRLLAGPRPAGYDEEYGVRPREGELPLLTDAERARGQPVELPRPDGARALQVIGIPLPRKGLHVVEFASQRLGASLHGGADRPYWVYSSALVTNLAVHFKHGRESSAAWVTRLDNAQPVAGARVQVSDCTGEPQWSGTTDEHGIARIAQELPYYHRWKECPHAPEAYLVTARRDDDLALLLTTWNEGIRAWQFNLAGGWALTPIVAHAVTDRPLYRAGETVSIKHFVRRRTGGGFAAVSADGLPERATITHVGSGQRFDAGLQWRGNAATSRWEIPTDAKTGEYAVWLAVGDAPAPVTVQAGSFRVEQFRVPLMRAVLKPPAAPVIGADKVDIDVQLNYLAGGAAGGAAVRFRSRVVPHVFSFPEYDDFRFGGAVPQEGISAHEPGWLIDFDEEPAEEGGAPQVARTQNVTLDAHGGARVAFDGLPRVDAPQALEVEMEYADPNGQILTAATRALLLPSNLALGLRLEGFFASRDRLAFKVQALDAAGRPQADRSVRVEAYERKRYAYRKRLLGGFYAYEQTTEVKRLAGAVCRGRTDARGLLACAGSAPAAGELILVARADDAAGRTAIASTSVYVAGSDATWFAAGASDRIDLLPDRRAYEPGDTARFELRMPFRAATVLVAVEREGVLDLRVVDVDAKSPYFEVPMRAGYGPNVYVSALAVRGRVEPEVPGPFAWLKRFVYRIGQWLGLVDEVPKDVDTRPTGLVDLTRPSFRLGMTQVRVGWRGYELKVKVEPDQPVYRVRDTATVTVAVSDADGRPAAGAEVALAAVDEGLLRLAPNRSWDLLGAMMARRAQEVETSTAQGQVIGKRHFGKKSAPPGGGGGASTARELFDTLLLWQPRVLLDAQGRARVDVPLNDSLTSFRIEAIAHAGDAQFGSGGTSVRTTQDVMLFAGLSPFVREGDRFDAMFTVRNGADRALTLDLEPTVAAAGTADDGPRRLPAQRVELAPGAAQTLTFAADVPAGSTRLDWSVVAREAGGAGPTQRRAQDTVKLAQTVGAAHPVRVRQQTLLQLAPAQPQSFAVELPAGALPGRGGVDVRLAGSLGGDVASIRAWMAAYPFTCIEQRASVAVALEDAARWDRVMNTLPAHLDGDGLVRFFPAPGLPGDDTLTAYLLAVAHEAGYEIPAAARGRMLKGLADFVAGRITRWGSLPTADLAIRRVAAIEALARYGAARPAMLESVEVLPQLWPSSAVIDWLSLLERIQDIPQRQARIDEARQILRTRLAYSGTTLLFSTEKSDYLWWLMISPDRNAVRLLLLAADDPTFGEDIGRLARGALGRQLGGRWNTTVANAWGVLALRRFQSKFEREPVTGVTAARLGALDAALDWRQPLSRTTGDPTLGTPIGSGPGKLFPWPQRRAELTLDHRGSGRPWAFVASKAAVALDKPQFAGYAIRRSVEAIERKIPGAWSRGDVLRVRVEIDAQQDMTWVVLADPIPAGATVLGTGLGGDSSQLAAGEKKADWSRPTFEERTFEGYRAYFRYLPKGKVGVEYTVRLNNAGRFELPASRVEAMYAPEIYGELPVAAMEIGQ